MPVIALGGLLLVGPAYVSAPVSKQLHHVTRRESMPSPLAQSCYELLLSQDREGQGWATRACSASWLDEAS